MSSAWTRWSAAFDVADVNANPARFDPKKCEAINATHIRLLPPDEFAVRLRSFADEIGTKAPAGLIESAAPLVQERIRTLREGLDLIHFLLVAEADFTVDEGAAAKQLDGPGHDVVSTALTTLETVSDWTAGRARTTPARCACRRPRAEAEAGLRSRAGRGHGPDGVATAVRVTRAPRAGPDAGPAASRAGSIVRGSSAAAGRTPPSRRAHHWYWSDGCGPHELAAVPLPRARQHLTPAPRVTDAATSGHRCRTPGQPDATSGRRERSARLCDRPVGPCRAGLMGYGVIGSPTDSGSVSLGSSPGTPAVRSLHHRKFLGPRRLVA